MLEERAEVVVEGRLMEDLWIGWSITSPHWQRVLGVQHRGKVLFR